MNTTHIRCTHENCGKTYERGELINRIVGNDNQLKNYLRSLTDEQLVTNINNAGNNNNYRCKNPNENHRWNPVAQHNATEKKRFFRIL